MLQTPETARQSMNRVEASLVDTKVPNSWGPPTADGIPRRTTDFGPPHLTYPATPNPFRSGDKEVSSYLETTIKLRRGYLSKY